MKPVRVYLDTQDFSRFASHTISDADAELYTRLANLERSGRAEFGFSYLHMSELFDLENEDFYEKDFQRAIVLEKLCRKNTWPFLADFISNHYRFSMNGNWLPSAILNEIDELPLFERCLTQTKLYLASEHGLPRKLRKKYSTNSGVRERLSQSGGLLANGKLSGQLIDLGDVLSGRKNKKIFNAKFKDQFSRPTEFIKHSKDNSSTVNVMRAHLDVKAKEIFYLFCEIIELSKDAKVRNDSAKKLFQPFFSALEAVSPAQKKDIKRFQSFLKNERHTFSNLKLHLPHHDYFDHVEHWLNIAVRLETIDEMSVVADLLHLTYANDCDLMRVDRRLGDAMKGYLPFKGRLVDNRFDLPDLIESFDTAAA